MNRCRTDDCSEVLYVADCPIGNIGWETGQGERGIGGPLARLTRLQGSYRVDCAALKQVQTTSVNYESTLPSVVLEINAEVVSIYYTKTQIKWLK